MALTAQQKRVLAAFNREADRQKATKKERLALVAAGLVEANLGNPRGGDRDSVGSLQERSHYGSDKRRLDPVLAARRFLKEARAINHEGMSAGQLAQAVQRSAFPERYDERKAEAAALLDDPKSTPRTGGSAPKSSGGSTTTTTTRTERDVQGAILDALASGRPGSKLKQASALLDSGAYDRQVTDTKTVKSKAAKASSGRKSSKAGDFFGSEIFEAFYDPEGGIDNGTEIGAIGDHSDHVHLAAGPETLRHFERMAKQFKLKVTSKDRPGDTDSFHGRKRAIDVAGDPADMAAYYRAVKAYDQRVRRR